MSTTGKRPPRTVVVATTILLLAAGTAPAAAVGGHDHDHGQRRKHAGRSWVPPLPPAPPLPRALPRARVFAAPRTIHVHRGGAYSPYYAGRVFHAPYRRWLDVYYFPVAVGPRIVYEPHYYCDGPLYYGVEAGTPRFYFSITI